MTNKQAILVNVPIEKYQRMKKVMAKERQNNKTAFILNAIDAVCDGQERDTSTEKIEKALSILAENVRISEANARSRHIEVMAWIDTLAQVVCTDDGEYEKFQIAVNHELQQRKGTN
jgi:CRISPR/Cas system-associated endonuclease Cas3-HD